MCPRGARLLAGEGGLLERTHVVCHCLLIEGADGLVLVDTGFGQDDVRRPRRLGLTFNVLVSPRPQMAETAIEQVRALGFDPRDVRHIVTTHLDPDHSGGLPDFPHADVHVLAAELHAAMHPAPLERTRYIGAHWGHGPRWVEHDVDGDEWLGFDGVRILPGSDAEILLIPLAGHTRGHTGVAVRTSAGWLLHCGDAYFNRAEVQTPPHCPPGLSAFQYLNQVDGGARRRNRERLRELAERHGSEVQLICSHDAHTLEECAHATPLQAVGGA
jgi:glyoxylase-like metal-dependent hydrolase (beta-lactamase superfamily II)